MENAKVKKKLCKLLKILAFMMKRGLLSKQRVLADVNMALRRSKMVGRSLAGTFTYFLHGTTKCTSSSSSSASKRFRDYEFSCSSSPDTHHNHSPSWFLPSMVLHCMHPPPAVHDHHGHHEWSSRFSAFLQLDYNGADDHDHDHNGSAPSDEWLTPHCSSASTSTSRWSTAEEDEEDFHQHAGHVDKLADEFIAKFYDDIKLQRQSSILQYQEMLARGAN